MKAFFLLLFLLIKAFVFAQLPTQDSLDSLVPRKDSVVMVKDSVDSTTDSVVTKLDSTTIVPVKQPSVYENAVTNAMSKSKFLETSVAPSPRVSKLMPVRFYDSLFYVVVCLLIFFAFLKFLYQRYFNNMFRVFFNTSLRQSQLADQLLQSRQISLFYNLLFAVTGGLYVYFLLNYFKWIGNTTPVVAVAVCTVTLALIYFIKYSSLIFTGWITGYGTAANTYLFIIFLINKILGVILIPFVIVIAFGQDFLRYPAILISLLVVGLMFLLRFLRSYGLLRKDIKVSRFHFLIYILSVEVLPLLLIYKSLMILFGKNG